MEEDDYVERQEAFNNLEKSSSC